MYPNRSLVLVLVLVIHACVAVTAVAADLPVAVSPGLADQPAAIPSACPTFLWGQVAGAVSYELRVYRLDRPEEPELRQRLGGSVHGWAPTLERCLEAGRGYAWLIGAKTGDEGLVWSEPKLFRTAPSLSRAEFERALGIVREYLAQEEEASDARGTGVTSAAAGSTGAFEAAAPESRALPSPDSVGLTVEESALAGIAFGVHGVSQSTGDGSTGVAGQSTAATGDTAGVAGEVASAAGSAGVFDNTAGGDILRGLNNGTQVFEVAGTGQVTATGFSGDGSGLTGVSADDADTLDALDSTAFLQKTELDTEAELEAQIGAADVIVSTEIDSEAELEARIGGANVIVSTEIDSESTLEGLLADVADVLTDNDSVDADTVGGLTAASFVLKAGDTMAGDLDLGGNELLQGAASFLHNTGTANTAAGLSALSSLTTGSNSTAVGNRALYSATTGNYNTAMGDRALTSLVAGSRNVAVGSYALEDNTGDLNTGVGNNSLRSNTTGFGNVGVGSDTLDNNTIGYGNTALGHNNMTFSTAGNQNTAIGQTALYGNTTGSRNVGLGLRAGYNATTGDDNIFIANEGVAAESDKIRIGVQGTQTETYLAGIYGTPLAGSSVVVTAAGQLGVAAGASGDADTLDGLDSTAFLQKTELDSEAELEGQIGVANVIVSTEIDSEAKLEGLLADVSDVLTDNDSVNADTLDALDSTAFVAVVGDTMTGTLTLTPGAGNALVANDDVNLASGNLLKGGTLFLHDDGADNASLGASALSSVTTGYENVAAGASALAANTTGYGNTAAGHEALEDNLVGSQNTAIGRQALNKNTGSFNTAVGSVALFNNTTGSSNTAVGRNALVSNTAGTLNTALGHGALGSNTTADGNTAVGRQALTGNTTGNLNVAVGRDALEDNDTGSGNTATGSNALSNNTTGQGNAATGHFALRDNTTGQRSTAMGGFSLARNTGSRNVGLGYRAGYNATAGDDNIFIANEGVAAESAKIKIGVQGTQTATYLAGIYGTALAGSSVVVTAAGQLGVAAGPSGDADTLDGIDSLAFLEETELDTEAELEGQIGVANVIISTEIDSETKLEGLLGDVADVLTDNDSVDADTLDGIDSTGFLQAVPNHGFATRNTRIGQDALASNTTGSDNTASGYRALNQNTSGYDNTATGGNALRFNTTGTNNTAHGYDALRTNVSGDFNTALGDRALQANTADKNTALGAESLRANSTGTGNTAAGYAALLSNTTGFDNTAMGYKALSGNVTGARNVAFGGDALRYSTGVQNTAIGDDALRANTSGGQNAAVGQDVMISNTTGSHNAALGSGALFNNLSGDHNSAVGEEALRANTSGDYNVAVGSDSLYANTTGLRNIAVGRRAGFNVTTGSDNILVGNEGVGGDSAKIRVGVQGTQTATYVAGIFGSPLTGSNVVVTATGRLGVAMGASGDADTLDGIDSLDFLEETELDSEAELEAQLVGVANVLTNNDAVDAATLDGFDSPDFVAVAGDTMTGTLTLSPGAGDALVTTAGEVGLGTAAPSKTLHVKGTGASSGALFHHDAVGAPITSPFVSVETDVYSTTSGILSVIDRRMQTGASETPTLRVENTHAATVSGNPLVEVEAAGSPRFLVEHGGRVGMGTSSPAGGLHVVHDGAQLYLEDSGSGAERHVAQLFMDASKVRLIANHFTGAPTLGMSLESRNAGVSVEAVTIAGDGDVGIGDATPTNKLTVAGDLSVGNETEALDNPGFVLDGNDLYVSGTAGVDGTIYTDSGLTVGATTTLTDGSMTSSGDMNFEFSGGWTADSDNVNINATGVITAVGFNGDGSGLTGVSDTTRVAKAGDTMTGTLNVYPTTGLPLDVLVPSQASTTETLLRARVSDNAVGTLSFFNNALGDGEFIPALKGESAGSSFPALALIGDATGADSGTEAAVVLQGQVGAGPLASRHVLRVQNQGTVLMAIDKDGNVGLGTTTPTDLLHGSGGGATFEAAANTRLTSIHDQSADAIAGVQGYGTGIPDVGGGFILAAALGTSKHLGGVGDNDPYLHIRSSLNDFHIGQAVPFVTVDGSSGNVGIGDTTPVVELEVTSVIRTTPTDTPGTCDGTTEGSFYYDFSLGAPCFCDGTSWERFDGGGTC